MLDIDLFATGERHFESQRIINEAKALAARAYAFFRWSITPEFIKVYGGRA